MYEITNKGAWFRWSALDRGEKGLLVASCLLALPPAMLAGTSAGELGYRLGHWLGSGGSWPDERNGFAQAVDPRLFAAFAILAAVSAALSAFFWWRFSRRQDELFNRVQNHALGHGSAWTLAAITLWWMLSLGGLLPPVPPGIPILLAFLLIAFFWLAAARKWA